ncbi:MAG TPA: RsbRD N-terminal domain-containing protein [Mucilaginibacter sp.]|nr:RsbRD N-terminal domain-containing protein [Mucilaginibacter sp.]
MPIDITKILKKNQAAILERWMKNQLSNAGLRDDLMSNDDLRTESDELVSALVNSLNERTIDDIESGEFDHVIEILSGISISRAKQGFSPRETGMFIMSLKEALLEILQEEINDPVELYETNQKVSRLLDNFSIITFETFIKGREEVILRQTDEITEISTPVIRVWDGILALPIIGTLDSART